MRITLALAGTVLWTVAAATWAGEADSIWFGGPIVTVDDRAPSAEAVAVKDGRIVAVGSRERVFAAEKGAATHLIDLDGRTLIPGFFDAHSHLGLVGFQAVSANLLPPPDGPGSSIAELQKVMRDYIATSPRVKDYGVAIGFDYDDSQLAEHRHPTRQELDAVSTDVPIVVIHQSGHIAVMNSRALEAVGYTAETPDPPGGVIRREADGKTPNGVLEELAHINATPKLLPKFTPAQALEMIGAAQEIYLANGFTTAQEGRAMKDSLGPLLLASREKALLLDVVAYIDLAEMSGTLEKLPPSHTYTDHFRVGGAKLTYDGSANGKTAWFTQPYFQPPEGQKPGYSGYPAFPQAGEAQKWVDLAYEKHWQLLVHANGDAAVDELIETVRNAQGKYGGGDRRTVLVHGQYLRPDQVPQLRALGIIPSLYPMHTFYWGDWHRESVAGPKRAEFISPTGAVLRAGMKFTIHSDAPVTFPNSMRVLDSAVNRTTRSGYVLGPDQRISPEVALKAMTLWAAYQHFEDGTKGSLEVGKLADMVVLSANPLTVPRATIKDIRVLETIKEGKTVYSAAR
jgi:hypothetical protein